VQVALVVFKAHEACFAVVAALHDLERGVIELDARAMGHLGIIAKNNRRLYCTGKPLKLAKGVIVEEPTNG
jgi:hypothetical protein